MNKIITILSIDAWADGDHSWSWNQWYKIGEIESDTLGTLQSEHDTLDYLIREGYLTELAFTQCMIEDDQYNLVACNKETGEPLIAIAYGEVQ